MPELSAEILFLFIFTSLSTFFITYCITLPKILIKRRLFFFPFSTMYMLAAFAKVLYLLCMSKHFLGLFSFWQCMQLCVLFLLCYCLELWLTATGFLFWIPLVFWILSHAILLPFVISLILLDNFFCLGNFSLLFQELILRILTTLFILTDPSHKLIFY